MSSSLSGSLFDYMQKFVRYKPEDYRFAIPGNTAIEVAARQRNADIQINQANDRETEKELTQFSSPYGPIKIRFYIGHTTTGAWYMKSSMSGMLDSGNGYPLTGRVEGYATLSGPEPTEHELFMVARKLYLEGYNHEAEEHFRWNNNRVLNPHDRNALKGAP